MTTVCTYCGQALPGEGTRFCNNCGRLVPSHSFSPQPSPSLSSPESNISSPPQSPKKPVLREQIAELPPARRTRRMVPIETLPTTPLVASSPEQLQSATFPEAHSTSSNYYDEVEQLDTVPLSTRIPLDPSPNTSLPVQGRMRRSAPQAPMSPVRRKNRVPLIVVLSLLCLLLVGGVGAWVFVFQPFSVPPVTRPQQSFNDTNLGLVVLYPNGWLAQIDRHKATIHFSDSSHTAQVDIVVTNATTGDVAQYAQQQATKLGITGGRLGAPLSFAGSSWEHIQGNVQQKGANYTEALLATHHGNHLFTILQLAPQSIYSEEERIIFSTMRSSFQFL